MGAKKERWISRELRTFRIVYQDGNKLAGRFADRPSDPSNLGMGSARGGSERLVSSVGSDRLEGMSELMG